MIIAYAAGLFAFWVLLIPDTTPAALLIGAAVVAATVWSNRWLLLSRADLPQRLGRALPAYLALTARFVVEVVRANIEVARTVLDPRLPIRPQFVRLPLPPLSEFHRVLAANAITLTPGTISVAIEGEASAGGVIVVHALTDAAATGLADHFAVRALSAIEQRSQA